MSLYKFIAKDQSGKNVTGEVEAFDEKALVATLRSENLVPINISIRGARKFEFATTVPKFGGGVSYSEIVSFTRQLSTMISAGLPIADALVILEKQTKSQKFQKVLSVVVADVEGGTSLSSAFAKHTKVFDEVYVRLIEAGETGGVLDKILAKLADTMEKEKEFKAKTRGAFIYPIIVVAVMLVVITIMLIFVIPKLTGIYEEIGAELPLPTRILIAASDFVRGFWWLLIILGVSGIWGIKNF
ncbi:MAG TPA: type II secretion system F family protein, partial [Patescibacteria group bacterium]|nr:type II secretion system F family protein [Patescibacteria group bacterium]